jgi:hypothetical protein
MGNCCKSRKSQNEEERLIHNILFAMKINQTSFSEVHQLLYNELYNPQIITPSDPTKKIKKYELSEIAANHFYENDEKTNIYLSFHKDFFELISSKLCPNGETEIPCYFIIFLLLPFLKDSNSDKMTYFNYITSHKITCENTNINNIEFIEVLKEYLRINLSYLTSVMSSIIVKNTEYKDKVESLEKLRKICEDQNKLNLFVDAEFPIKTNGERLETMETLRINSFIFNFYELRSSYLDRYYE